MIVPEEMKREVVWTQHRWSDKTDEEWFDMCSRLLSPPEVNFQYWDWIEAHQLEEYVTRGEQVKESYEKHPFLLQNVANARRALDYCYDVLACRWQILPQLEGVMGLKEAIRKNQVIDTRGTFMNNPGPIIDTLKRCVSDMDMAMKLDEDPNSITKTDWHRMMNSNPTPILEQSLNRCSQELGVDSKNKE